MVEFLARDLERVERLNRLRAGEPSSELVELEASFESRFGSGSRLDRFEGSDDLRILVPVFRGERVVEVAKLYETRRGPNPSGSTAWV